MLPSSSLNDDRFSLGFFLSQDIERSSSLVFTYWWYSFLIDLISYSTSRASRRSIINIIRTITVIFSLPFFKKKNVGDENDHKKKKKKWNEIHSGATQIQSALGPSAILSRQVIYTSRSRGERCQLIGRLSGLSLFFLAFSYGCRWLLAPREANGQLCFLTRSINQLRSRTQSVSTLSFLHSLQKKAASNEHWLLYSFQRQELTSIRF